MSGKKSNFSTECHYPSSERKMLNYALLKAYILMIQNTKLAISNKQYQNQNSNTGSCHGCSGPHLIKDYEDSVCKRCKPNLDDQASARYPRRRPPSKQQKLNP